MGVNLYGLSPPQRTSARREFFAFSGKIVVVHGLAIPYGSSSIAGVGRSDYFCEVCSPGAFRKSVETGLSAKGKPIFACWGHKRDGRRTWRIGSTADGSLRLWEDERGVWFSLSGATLPKTFTGVSVMLEPLRWRRETGLLWRLLEGGIRHVAILTAPAQPAYPDTFMATLRATMNLKPERERQC